MLDAHPDVPVYTAALDRELNEHGLHSARPRRRRRSDLRDPDGASMTHASSTAPRARSPARCTCSRPRARGWPARRRALPGARAPSRSELNADPAVRSPAHRRRGAEPRAHRPQRPAAAPGAARLPRADLLHARHARPLRRDAARRRAHPGEGRRVPGTARQGRTRSASRSTPCAMPLGVQDLMVGVPYRRIQFICGRTSPFEYTDAGHILGSASVDLRITEGDAAPPRLQRRHRPERPADHPRPRSAVRRRSTR